MSDQATFDTTHQEEFDTAYITSSEICEELQINRVALLIARKRGFLPNAIMVNGNQLTLWRRDLIRPHITSWKATIQARRGKL